jgi:hypothetical protein
MIRDMSGHERIHAPDLSVNKFDLVVDRDDDR